LGLHRLDDRTGGWRSRCPREVLDYHATLAQRLGKQIRRHHSILTRN
jgi:hypothetical protein